MRRMESLQRLLLWSWCGQSLFRCVHPKVPWSLGRGCTDSDHGCWVESFALSIASPTFRLEPSAYHEWVFKASFSCLSLSCCVHLCERAKSSLKFSLVLKKSIFKGTYGIKWGSWRRKNIYFEQFFPDCGGAVGYFFRFPWSGDRQLGFCPHERQLWRGLGVTCLLSQV